MGKWGWNFRLCAVDQKSQGWAVSGPFLDPLTGREGLLTGRSPYGEGTLPELGGNFRLCAVNQKRSFFPRVMPFLDLLPFQGLFPLTGALTGRPPYGKVPYGALPFQGPCPLTGALTGKPPYGKAPYGEASYEKAPYELQESLREATGRDFTRIGREFPLVCRRPKKVVFS